MRAQCGEIQSRSISFGCRQAAASNRRRENFNLCGGGGGGGSSRCESQFLSSEQRGDRRVEQGVVCRLLAHRCVVALLGPGAILRVVQLYDPSPREPGCMPRLSPRKFPPCCGCAVLHVVRLC